MPSPQVHQFDATSILLVTNNLSNSHDKIVTGERRIRHRECHFPPQNHLDWLALREHCPDVKRREVLIVLLSLADENGQVGDRCHRELVSACGLKCRRTLQRRLEELASAGELDIRARRVARDFNGPNTYIIKNYAAFVGGGGQICHGETPTTKAEDVVRPAGPDSNSAPSKPVPHKPRTRHIVAASRIKAKFCSRHKITYGWVRLTQRIMNLLNAGGEEEAILAELDREYRARSAPVSQSKRTRNGYTCYTATYGRPQTPSEIEAKQERDAATEREFCIGLVTCSARVREEMLRCKQCTQEDIDAGYRLVAELQGEVSR